MLLTINYNPCVTVSSDEDYFQSRACCTFKGPHFEDMEYIRIISLNKIAVLEYNHTRGSWIGFTPYTIELAKFWNLNPFGTREAKALCSNNLGYIQILSKTIFP